MTPAGEERSPIAPPTHGPQRPAARGGIRHLPLLAVLVLPALAPPEVHGTAMAGGAALVVLAFVLAVAGGSLSRAASALTVAAAAAGVVLAVAADAPGAAWTPWAAAVLALAVAVAASAGGRGDRSALAGGVAWSLTATGAWIGARAVWERWIGLETLAEQVRAGGGIAWREAILDRLEQGRAYAGLVTPAAAGIFLVMTLQVTVGLAARSRGRVRLAAAVAALVQLAGLVATRSLTAAGVLVGVSLLALLARGGRARRWGVGLAAGLAVAVLSSMIAWRGAAALSWEHPDSPWRQRAGNVRIALEITRQSPWIGVGPGGYGEVFPAFRRPGDNESRHAHCLPAELTAELGVVPGILASLAFFAFFFRGCGSALRSRDPVRAGLFLAGAAFALHNLVDFTAWLPSVLWPALIASGASVRRRAAPGASTGRPVAWAAVAWVVVAAGIAARGGLADDARREGLDAVAAGEPERALAELRRAVALAPWSPDAAVASAAAILDGATREPGNLQVRAEAREACERAVTRSPVRAVARALRGRARMLDRDIPGAFADFRRAAELDPLRSAYAADRDAFRGRLPGAIP